jgi:hypothetical protein
MNAKVELLRWIVSCLKVFRDRTGDSKIGMKGYANFISKHLENLISESKEGQIKETLKKSLEILKRIQKHRKLTQPVFSSILQEVIDDLDECLEKVKKY